MTRIAVQIAVYFLFQALLLFGAAGTWDWPAAWGYLGLQVVLGQFGSTPAALEQPGCFSVLKLTHHPAGGDGDGGTGWRRSRDARNAFAFGAGCPALGPVSRSARG